MRFFAKQATTLVMICLGYCIAFNTAAFAQDTANTTAGDKSDFVSDVIKAAEQSGVQIIVINGEKNDSGTNTEDTPDNPNILTAEDYENLSMSMPEVPGSASAFMKAQTGLLDFRDLLKANITQIPESIITTGNELRKNSPTGD